MSMKNDSEPPFDDKLLRCSGSFLTYYWDAPAKGAHFYGNVAYISVNIFISIPGTVFNILVITVYARNKNIRTLSNMLFILLAVSDLMVNSIVQPLLILRTIQELFGTRHCITWAIARLLSYFCCGVSLLTVGIITIERFITLAYPYHYKSIITPLRLKLTVAITWFCIFALVVSHLGLISYTILSSVGASLIILTIACILPMWVWIQRLVHKHRSSIGSTNMPAVAWCVDGKQTKGVLRTTGTCYFIVGAALLFYFPSLVMLAYNATHEANFFALFLLSPWAETVMFMNSLFNPLLLFTRKKSFRESAWQLVFDRESESIVQTERQPSHQAT